MKQESPNHPTQPPSVAAMIALVAGTVALVIILFFALGYGFGRLFL